MSGKRRNLLFVDVETTGLTYEDRVITLGTVKSHLNHIFGKLGVEGRLRAVNRARELALIE